MNLNAYRRFFCIAEHIHFPETLSGYVRSEFYHKFCIFIALSIPDLFFFYLSSYLSKHGTSLTDFLEPQYRYLSSLLMEIELTNLSNL